MAEKFKIDVEINARDNTKNAAESAQSKMTAFEKSMQKISAQLSRLSGSNNNINIGIKDMASKAVNNVWSLLKSIGSRAWEFILNARDNASRIVQNVLSHIKEVAGRTWNAVINARDGTAGVIGGILSRLKEIGGKAWTVILNARDNASRIVQNVLSHIKEVAGRTWNAVINARDSASKIISNVWNHLKEVSGRAWEFILNARDKASDVITRISGSLRSVAGKAWDFTIGAMDKATVVISKLTSTLNHLVGKAWNITVGIFDKVTAPLQSIGKALTSPIATVGAAIGTGALIKETMSTGMEFGSKMSNVQAVTLGSRQDREELKDLVYSEAKRTKFTTGEAADALQYMGMAGWNITQMKEALPSILNLAAAGNSDLATTSDIVTDAMTAFGYSETEGEKGINAKTVQSFADILATASSHANTNVPLLGDTFKYAASVAGTLGYSLGDVALASGIMANSSTKGSMAGTALRAGLVNMSAPSDPVAAVMDKYNLSLKDANGNAKDLRTVLKDVRSAFKGVDNVVDEAGDLAKLVGKYGLAGWAAIVNATEEDFNALAEAIDNCDGAAEKMSEIQLDNLQGDVYKLTSAWDVAQKVFTESLEPYVRPVIQKLTQTVNTFHEKITSGFRKLRNFRVMFTNAMDMDDDMYERFVNSGHPVTVKGKLKFIWDETIGNSFNAWWDKKVKPKLPEKLENIFPKGSLNEYMYNSFTDGELTFGGKVKIAWDTLIVTPFKKWWNDTGREIVTTIANEFGKGSGMILSGGLKALLGLADAADDGKSVAGSFVEGFKEGFDSEEIKTLISDAFNDILDELPNIWGKFSEAHPIIAGILGAWGISNLGGKLLDGAGSIKEAWEEIFGKGSHNPSNTQTTSTPGTYSCEVMNVTAGTVYVNGPVVNSGAMPIPMEKTNTGSGAGGGGGSQRVEEHAANQSPKLVPMPGAAEKKVKQPKGSSSAEEGELEVVKGRNKGAKARNSASQAYEDPLPQVTEHWGMSDLTPEKITAMGAEGKLGYNIEGDLYKWSALLTTGALLGTGSLPVAATAGVTAGATAGVGAGAAATGSAVAANAGTAALTKAGAVAAAIATAFGINFLGASAATLDDTGAAIGENVMIAAAESIGKGSKSFGEQPAAEMLNALGESLNNADTSELNIGQNIMEAVSENLKGIDADAIKDFNIAESFINMISESLENMDAEAVKGLNIGENIINTVISNFENFDSEVLKNLNIGESLMSMISSSFENIDITNLDIGSKIATAVSSSLELIDFSQFEIGSKIAAGISASLESADITPAVQSLMTQLELLHTAECSPQINAVDNASETISYIQSLADVYGATNATAILSANDNASSVIASVSNALDALNGKTASVTVNITTNGSIPSEAHFAAGTRNAPGGWSVINDQRGGSSATELVDQGGKLMEFAGRDVAVPLLRRAKVYTARQRERMLEALNMPRYAGGKDNKEGILSLLNRKRRFEVKEDNGQRFGMMSYIDNDIEKDINTESKSKVYSGAGSNLFDPYIGFGSKKAALMPVDVDKITDKTGLKIISSFSALKRAVKSYNDNKAAEENSIKNTSSILSSKKAMIMPAGGDRTSERNSSKSNENLRSSGNGGISINVTMSPTIEINAEAGIEEKIAEILKSKFKDMADDVARQIADDLAKIFPNIPTKGVAY